MREFLWMLSNLFHWTVKNLGYFQFTVRKEKQSEKESTRQKLEEKVLYLNNQIKKKLHSNNCWCLL